MKLNRIVTCAVFILMAASFLLLEYGGEPVAAQAPEAPFAEEDLPTFWASPNGEWLQSSSPWTPGVTISLTIEDGGGVAYSDSQTADAGGHFFFDLRDLFDLQRGHVVTVSDGTITKTHTVTNLFADYVDVAGDDVLGRADAGSDVEVWVYGGGGVLATADGSGNWTADFSGMSDITYLSEGSAQQNDADGDATWVHWAGPQFWAAPDDEWVQSSSQWTPGATVLLTIADGGGVVYADSQTIDAGGNFFFSFGGVIDLQRGDVVTVSDGTYAKTHVVANLYVDIVNVGADTLSGRADAGADVDVWAEGSHQTVTADGSGNWTADFSGTTDITYLSGDDALQSDADGDATWVRWAGPTFQAAPEDDWVESEGSWTPGATISLAIEDGGGVVYADSKTADAYGNFNFDLGGVFDLQRGHVVTVSDGLATKTHTVIDLFVDGVDAVADTVFGRAEAGAEVEVWVHDDYNSSLTVTADGSGNWVADFSGMTDLTYASDGGSQQVDDDGDATGVWWHSPRFQVAPEDDWVQSSNSWTPGATISLTIEDGGGVVYADSQTADAYGNFNFELGGVFDLQRGHVVTVSDGLATKTHTVIDLFVDGVDAVADTVFGRAEAGAEVEVWVHDDYNSSLTVTADGSGNWVADFSGMTDLTYASDGGSQQVDDDGDATGVWWHSPRFQVAPEDDWVQSSNSWTPGATISLTIEDGGGVVYVDSQTADGNGRFNFNLWDVFDLQRGHVVTISDGINSKVHTVTNLFVDVVNVTADTVSGRADAGSDVEVSVHDGEGTNLVATADGSGNWTADFSGMTDLTYQSDGGSQQFDDDGDATGMWWNTPQFRVAIDDWVQSSSRWSPGATISLTIEDGGGVVYADSQPADAGGSFDFYFGDVFELQRGHEVTVSDGMITKTHTVTNLFVDGIDVDADIVFGRADAGSDVDVWVHDDQDSNMIVTADGSGNWLADFSSMTDLTYASSGGSQQFDDDGDATGVWWRSPQFWVAPDDDWVQSSSQWSSGATISLTIEDGGGVLYADLQTANSDGNFSFNLGGVFDLQRGYAVTVSDGTITKTHTVSNLFVDGVDVDGDTVFGRADAGAEVDVWVHDDQGSSMTVTADGSGEWTADFSAMSDLTYESDGGSQQIDEDGDATGVWWAAATVQEIYLNEGWNMISSYIEAGDPAVASILADIVDDVVLMKDGAGNVYWLDMGIDEIGSWDVHQGYQIYMDNAAVLRIYGAIVDPAATPIELESGWSLIAYLRDGSTPVGPALDTISGALHLAKNGVGEVYWPVYGVDQIGDMQPGQGYQVYMDGPGTLTYP